MSLNTSISPWTDASEYKHVCLDLIFLKYISDAFEEKREQLLFGFSDPKSESFIKDEPQRADAAENRDEYLAANVFWLPPEARRHTIKAKSPEISGRLVSDDGFDFDQYRKFAQNGNV